MGVRLYSRNQKSYKLTDFYSCEKLLCTPHHHLLLLIFFLCLFLWDRRRNMFSAGFSMSVFVLPLELQVNKWTKEWIFLRDFSCPDGSLHIVLIRIKINTFDFIEKNERRVKMVFVTHAIAQLISIHCLDFKVQIHKIKWKNSTCVWFFCSPSSSHSTSRFSFHLGSQRSRFD